MPYINRDMRKEFEFCIEQLTDRIETVGELNYVITKLCDKYVITHGVNYENYNAVLGVLTAVTSELYRRKVTPYEDTKMMENGDVFEFKPVCEANKRGKLCADTDCPVHGTANKITMPYINRGMGKETDMEDDNDG